MTEPNSTTFRDQTAINVLVVDDESVIASEIVEFLSFEQIGAVAAQDGPAALHCLDEAKPGAFTVMLTDVRMPGTNGLALANDVRAMASEANAIEVILMTGHGSHKVVQDATLIPAFECMAKPLSLSHLLNTIRRAHAATVVRRVNHRESIEDLVYSLERARALSERPASVERGCHKGPHCPGELPDGCPDWQRDPLSFALAREAALNGAEAAMPALDVRADGQWYGELLDRAADQARALLPAIEPLTELLLGRRPITRTTVTLRSVLDGLARRHLATLLPITTLPQDPVLLIDEEILSLVLDQLIDDVARSGPYRLPIRIDTEIDPCSMVIRAVSAAADAAPNHASLPTADLVSPNRLTAEMGGLGLRIAAAASRLLGSHIERTGACGACSTTTLVIATKADPGPFGA